MYVYIIHPENLTASAWNIDDWKKIISFWTFAYV